MNIRFVRSQIKKIDSAFLYVCNLQITERCYLLEGKFQIVIVCCQVDQVFVYLIIKHS